MAFIPAIFAAAFATTATTAATIGAIGAVVGGSLALGGALSQKAPEIPGLPAPPSITSATATAQQQTASLQAAQQYGGGTTDITLGNATLNPSNIQTKSLLGA